MKVGRPDPDKRIENELDHSEKIKNSVNPNVGAQNQSEDFDYTITLTMVGRDNMGKPMYTIKKKKEEPATPKPKKLEKPKPGAVLEKATVLRSVLPPEPPAPVEEALFLPDDTSPFAQPPQPDKIEPQSKIEEEIIEEKVDMRFRVSNALEIKNPLVEKKKEVLQKLSKKVDKFRKYLQKMLKLLAESDAGFSDRFSESFKIEKEDFEAKPDQQKIYLMFTVFEKLVVILRFNELLRMFKERVYRKLVALCKRYLKVFSTYKLYFTYEAEKFLDEHSQRNTAEIQAFTEEIKLFGYNRIQEEEEERIRVGFSEPATTL